VIVALLHHILEHGDVIQAEREAAADGRQERHGSNDRAVGAG
jgi:hypothetical protein